jgi:hypothetical protein
MNKTGDIITSSLKYFYENLVTFLCLAESLPERQNITEFSRFKSRLERHPRQTCRAAALSNLVPSRLLRVDQHACNQARQQSGKATIRQGNNQARQQSGKATSLDCTKQL